MLMIYNHWFLIRAPRLNIFDQNGVLDYLPFFSKWTLAQKLKMQIWQRWSRDYLNELQIRKKKIKMPENDLK